MRNLIGLTPTHFLMLQVLTYFLSSAKVCLAHDSSDLICVDVSVDACGSVDISVSTFKPTRQKFRPFETDALNYLNDENVAN